MDLSKLKFLVVDDSAMARDHIESLLKKLGANRVDKVENGKSALMKIKKSYNDGIPYSLIALDWEMPEMSGLDLLKLLRADPKMKESVVLIVSSKSDPNDLKLMTPLQPNGYLLKPFTDENFEKKVASLFPKMLKS